jgi:hypothetical protein
MNEYYENCMIRIGEKHGKFSEDMEAFESLIIDYTIKNKGDINGGARISDGFSITPHELIWVNFKMSPTSDFYHVSVVHDYISHVYEFELKGDDKRFWDLLEIFTDIKIENSENIIKRIKSDLDKAQ